MSGERVFLRSDVCAEPLVDRFYVSLLMAAGWATSWPPATPPTPTSSSR